MSTKTANYRARTRALHREIADARRAALEQAAKVCADYAKHLRENGAGWSAGHIIAEECERKIRALLEPSDER